MNRRAVLACLLSFALASHAQTRRPKRVVVLVDHPTVADESAVRKARWARLFAERGLIDGQDIEIIVFHTPLGEFEAAPIDGLKSWMRRAVEYKPDVILAHASGDVVEWDLLRITGTIPLILLGGLGIDHMNRRGLPVTGFQYSIVNLMPKRMELMKRSRPEMKRFAYVVPSHEDASIATDIAQINEVFRAAALGLGLEFVFVELGRAPTTEDVLDAIRRARVQGAEPASVLPVPREAVEQLAREGIALSGVGPGRAKNEGMLVTGWSVGLETNLVRVDAVFE